MAQDKIRTELVEHLLDVFAHTQDQDTIYAILQDLCTVREITEMSQRLEVARLLSEGASYLDIQEQTGASATTISRVSKCLNYGSGGYGAALGMLCGSQDEER
ncbi:MAG: YerC/YecD family TrpR-related protein [Coriobacteriales bacterium]|nr:YerC/YecD family TrpR-related protein [Coriobacteriaceae bacterium]MDY2722334.1 YerC/YecD family TrpR-related protein [Coriobacteriales bacterium]MDY5661486.1 YerC/YecD family TrpR-related protein [Coriobacteriales bacterium]